MNEILEHIIKKSQAEKVEPKESLVDKELSLKSAKVVSLKEKVYHINNWRSASALGVLLDDPKLGKVWFKTSAQFVWDLRRGDLVDVVVTCTGEGDGILWARKPKQGKVVQSAPKTEDELYYESQSAVG